MIAKDMYNGHSRIFERKSIAGQLLLRQKLITMKYDDNGNIMNCSSTKINWSEDGRHGFDLPFTANPSKII